MKYEQFVKQPREMSRRLNELAGLRRCDELENNVPAELQLENNEKWRSLPAGAAAAEKRFPSSKRSIVIRNRYNIYKSHDRAWSRPLHHLKFSEPAAGRPISI
ncbi:MAG TPA: hypothetical protein VJZ68_02935 [Nitrososphaera sp.]|nr:hypothetical protein [Nitrososphaera sp.]